MASIRKRNFGANKELECWIVDYRDQHGKRHIKSFPNKKSAEAWKVSAQHEIVQGTHTPASASKTVQEVWQLWIDGERQERLGAQHHSSTSPASRAPR